MVAAPVNTVVSEPRFFVSDVKYDPTPHAKASARRMPCVRGSTPIQIVACVDSDKDFKIVLANEYPMQYAAKGVRQGWLDIASLAWIASANE